MSGLIAWLGGLPDLLVYLLLGLGAALENLVPAIPADTFVAFGGLLTVIGNLEARWVFLATWTLNVASALLMYGLGFRHGPAFFERGLGRHLLRPHQMERVRRFYAEWGAPAIFLTRFLPGLRAIVPIFAGVSRHRARSVVLPLATASALWYGGLVWLGIVAGRNLELLAMILDRLNSALGIVAVLATGLLGWWWWRTRHPTE